MGTNDFQKKKKRKNNKLIELSQEDRKLNEKDVEPKANRHLEKRKRKKEHNVGVGKYVQVPFDDDISIRKEKKKKGEKSPRKGKLKNTENNNALIEKTDQIDSETADGSNEQHVGRSKKSLKKKKYQNSSKEDDSAEDQIEDTQNEVFHAPSTDEPILIRKKGKSKEAKKNKKKLKKDHDSLKELKSLEKEEVINEDDVYLISSGDEDCSKGMKKWITRYHESRPGLTILQERIDEFITVHEAKLEEERKAREARVAEGGWTVVTHHKGRKKTTDAESGITVGSVAQAVADNKLAKKKTNEVGLDFYRFQRKESQRNEIMLLQSKFEQDKKKIQQLRAARKFRPY
ncbi:CAX-interacting protein 4 isoform X2 [Cannabis sativa]|uniref:CAX-interacting protein 4 isoform X2 n=1 Tax=Cannabis sativa TaxID=3483 RepID=UPI0029CA10D7|nr:CAX-interacting protein 4 isoform X2 [Cannabis sativa]